MESTILTIADVFKSFESLKALDGISLQLAQRKVNILIGPNGSGKTTLINVISGLYKPDSGRVTFQGKDVTGLAPHKLYAMGIARTFQIPALFWKLTVLDNLLVAERNNPGESFIKSVFPVGINSWRNLLTPTWQGKESFAVEKASKILDLLGLRKLWDQPAHTLSGGQMKLVEIGRALMSDAKLLLLDEPVSGVNPTLAHEIFSRILTLRDQLGLTFFIVEHRLDIALRYVDQMFAMAFGRLITSGPPNDVMNDPKVVESYLGG
jgi:branched-chain amino acid transport system ATP-binding protein